jgi:uncharacterized phage-associated protein
MEAISEATVYGEVDSVDFAIYLNKMAQNQNLDVNVTKIQKWLYICYGLYLAAFGKQLLKERPKTWDYGPAFPRVHKIQKRNNNSLDNQTNTLPIEEFKKYDDVILATLGHFGKWTANELVAWTHKKGAAWEVTKEQEGMYMPMDNYDILRDFKEFVSSEEV